MFNLFGSEDSGGGAYCSSSVKELGSVDGATEVANTDCTDELTDGGGDVDEETLVGVSDYDAKPCKDKSGTYSTVKFLQNDLVVKETDITFGLRELFIIKYLKHHLQDDCYIPDIEKIYFNKNNKLVTIMKNYGQDISKLIHCNEETFHKTAKRLITIIANLHACGVVHGDLKIPNILTKDDCITIIDFNISQIYWKSSRLDKCAGSGYHRAPEVSCNQFITPAIDIWALGAVLYTICTGKYLCKIYESDNDDALVWACRWLKTDVNHLMNITHCEISNRLMELDVPDYCNELLSGMLTPNPNLRYNIGYLCKRYNIELPQQHSLKLIDIVNRENQCYMKSNTIIFEKLCRNWANNEPIRWAEYVRKTANIDIDSALYLAIILFNPYNTEIEKPDALTADKIMQICRVCLY